MSDMTDKQANSAHQIDLILENLSLYLSAIGSVARTMKIIPLELRQQIEPARERAEQLLDDRWNAKTGALTWEDIEPIASTTKTVALTYWGIGSRQGDSLISETGSNMAPNKEPVLSCADRVLHEIEKAKVHGAIVSGKLDVVCSDSEPISNAVKLDTGNDAGIWGEAVNERFCQALQTDIADHNKRFHQIKKQEAGKVTVLPVNIENLDPTMLMVATNHVAKQNALPATEIAEKLVDCPNLDASERNAIAAQWSKETSMEQHKASRVVDWFAATASSDAFGETPRQRRSVIADILLDASKLTGNTEVEASYHQSHLINASQKDLSSEQGMSEDERVRQTLDDLRQSLEGKSNQEVSDLLDRIDALQSSVRGRLDPDQEKNAGPEIN